MEIEKLRGRYIYQGELPCQREKDEAGRKKTELGAERERGRERRSGIKQRQAGQMRDGDARQVAEQWRKTVM